LARVRGVSTPIEIPAPAATGGATPAAVRFDSKVAILLRDDLAMWQQLNVAAFLVSGVVGAVDGIIGKPYEDADGTAYLAMCRQPITVLEGDSAVLASSLRRALDRELRIAVYTDDMFATGNDDDNRAAVRSVARDQLNLVGIGVYGGRGAVDKALKGARLHP
jgi:hypothetical protein